MNKLTASLLITNLIFLSATSQRLIVPLDGAQVLVQSNLQKEEFQLLQKIDSSNVNSLKRSAKLDSAAKHHALYLAKYYLDTKSISHNEDTDFPNFKEKIRLEDRTGEGKFGEICTVRPAWERTYKNEDLIKKAKQDPTNFVNNHVKILSDKRDNLFFKDYKDSPSHWKIIQNPAYNYFGSYTIFVCVYTTKGLLTEQEVRENLEKNPKGFSKEKIEASIPYYLKGDVIYLFYAINVVVFSDVK
jgi:uncharacterized protein YkwD